MEKLAHKFLTDAYGTNAEFREGQLEAIMSVLNTGNELVVRQTGWGKSLIYFILTNIYRSQNKGPVIIVSPLLSLVRNQILSASAFNLNAVSLSSDNKDDWSIYYEIISRNQADIIFLTPEHLANESNMKNLYSYLTKDFSLLVIDEVHCISDWGHDFRPDYKKIIDFISSLNYKIPILATTATANDRVISDITDQLDIVNISRGPLIRESLRIQVLNIHSRIERYAWILGYLKNTDKNGIIYCLTQKDTEDLNIFLTLNGINSASYNASSSDREDIENKFLNNELKCLTATIALGMGYDKKDIGFVIHYQRPGNIVSYYQQIGRAGRNISEADVIMFNGPEDERIQKHFIDDAFPKVSNIEEIIDLIKRKHLSNFKVYDLQKEVNIKKNKLDQILKYLFDNKVIDYEKGTYYVIDLNKHLDFEIFKDITKTRYLELDQMKEFIKLKTCYMEFLAKGLSDNNAKPCGKCANCLGHDLYSPLINQTDLNKAINFVENLVYMIKPRLQLPVGVKYNGIFKFKTKSIDYVNEIGYALTFEGEGNLGLLVKNELSTNSPISLELVEDLANLIKANVNYNNSFIVTHVPSNSNNELVKDLAINIAKILGLSYEEVLSKDLHNIKQKSLENAYQLFDNAINSYHVINNVSNRNIILIDDFVSSKWTITACGLKLFTNNAKSVYPFTLQIKRPY